MLRRLLPLHCGSAWLLCSPAAGGQALVEHVGAEYTYDSDPGGLHETLGQDSECRGLSPEDGEEGNCALGALQMRASRTNAAYASSDAGASADSSASAASSAAASAPASTAASSAALAASANALLSSAAAASASRSASAAASASASAAEAGHSAASAAARHQVNRRFFLWISDIHADTFYGADNAYKGQHATCKMSCPLNMPCTTKFTKRDAEEKPLGAYGCDPPLALWESALRAASRESNGAEFVLFTGDAVRHKQSDLLNPAENVTNILGNVTQLLVRNFPEIPEDRFVLGTLGNDDTPHNYEINVTDMSAPNPWLEKVSARLQDVGAMGGERKDEYELGGFFQAKVGGLTILSINTIPYSVKHKPELPSYPDPFGQFAWLREKLKEAYLANEHVWIVGHIPPGLETYGFTPLWEEKYLLAYLDIVQDPVLGSVVKGQLFGHVHADEIRILPEAPAGAGPILLMGAVSPIYYGNPSFRLMEYDEDSGELLNVKVFWANLSSSYNSSADLNWQFGYDFLGAYPSLKAAASSGENGLLNSGMEKFAKSLESSWQSESSTEWTNYVEWYKTRVVNDLMLLSNQEVGSHLKLSPEAKKRAARKYFCALNISSGDAFQRCAGLGDDDSNKLGIGIRPLEAGEDSDDPFKASDIARARHWISVATLADRDVVSKLVNPEALDS